jgi:hypothetical protein
VAPREAVQQPTLSPALGADMNEDDFLFMTTCKGTVVSSGLHGVTLWVFRSSKLKGFQRALEFLKKQNYQHRVVGTRVWVTWKH